MTQAVHTISTSLPAGAADIGSIAQLGLGGLLSVVVAGLAVWAFKKDWIGITTFGPYDRGYREFFGRPGRLLRRGPHPHIVGIGNLRRASVATSIVTLSNRVMMGSKVYLYIFEVSIHIVDEAEHILAAIYKTFDEGKKDAYNAQRIAYVKNVIEEAIREILEQGEDVRLVTVESINARCNDHLLLMCGTAISKLMLTEFTPVDAQIIKDGVAEARSDSAIVVPFPGKQQDTA